MGVNSSVAAMPKRRTAVIVSFGERLAALRKAAGFTQLAFAKRRERRLLEIKTPDPKSRRKINQLLDTFIAGEKLKQRLSPQGSTQET